MKRVVSISLGSSTRNKKQEATILGEEFVIERIGTDGDGEKFAAMFTELDGRVDALGVGGADIYLVVGQKKYAFTQVLKWISGAKKTPVVDGSGLKHTLERETIMRLNNEGIVDFKNSTTLLVSAVDRFGMAQALSDCGGKLIFGDLAFGIGIPIAMRSYSQVRLLGSIILPIVTKLPIQWFYPTGKQQEERKPKYPKFFEEADIIAGDWHYIRRYGPDRMDGKTIITQTVRKADLDWLRTTGAARLITTTPEMGGETFATNVMEGVIVALAGKKPSEMTEADYLDALKRLNWAPNVVDLKA
ncbi:MAG: quinate 5-dehydrogenase [Armatimonadetes bacterium]|nr:quinate 5-dehydrogenase [Armatimonadota bacterium]